MLDSLPRTRCLPHALPGSLAISKATEAGGKATSSNSSSTAPQKAASSSASSTKPKPTCSGSSTTESPLDSASVAARLNSAKAGSAVIKACASAMGSPRGRGCQRVAGQVLKFVSTAATSPQSLTCPTRAASPSQSPESSCPNLMFDAMMLIPGPARTKKSAAMCNDGETATICSSAPPPRG